MRHARTLQLTLQFGRELFGKEFPQERTASLRWLSDKAHQGCPLSTQLLSEDAPVNGSGPAVSARAYPDFRMSGLVNALAH